MLKKTLIAQLISAPIVVSAHGGGVTTLSATSGNFLVEFEYNKLTNITAGDFITFDTYLLDSNKNPQNFDTAYIRISTSNGVPVLSGNLTESVVAPGSADLSGTINTAGDYVSEVEFTKAGNQEATANYKFTVDAGPAPAKPKQSVQTILLEVILVVGGFILGYFTDRIVRRKINPENPNQDNNL